jgi:hypothetical protein
MDTGLRYFGSDYIMSRKLGRQAVFVGCENHNLLLAQVFSFLRSLKMPISIVAIIKKIFMKKVK